MLRQQLAGKGFDWLRKHYPARREFSALTVSGPDVTLLANLGFSVQAKPVSD
jgi:erythronate-4-phosphate dehydrogenase